MLAVKVFAITLLYLTLAVATSAQDIVGAIEGTATDTSGAALPGVTVTITSPSLIGGPKATATDEAGRYRFPLLPPGTYDLRAELSGFSTLLRRGLELRVGQRMTIDVPLAVATVTETVEVKVEAPVIDLRSNVREYTVDAEAISRIPLSTFQRYGDLFVLAPGVRVIFLP